MDPNKSYEIAALGDGNAWIRIVQSETEHMGVRDDQRNQGRIRVRNLTESLRYLTEDRPASHRVR